MKLNPGEWGWAPEEKPNLLCLMLPGENPPASLKEWLDKQVRMFLRLIAEEDEVELDYLEGLLKDELPFDFRQSLPENPLRSPNGPSKVLRLTPESGSPLAEWKRDAEDLLDLGEPGELLSKNEAGNLLLDLNLGEYISYALI